MSLILVEFWKLETLINMHSFVCDLLKVEKKKKKKKKTGKKRLEPQLKLETKFNTSGNDLPTWPYYPTSYGMNQYYTLVYICNWMAFASLSWFANNPCLYCIDIWIHLVLWLRLTVILVAQQSISMNERHWAEQQIPFFFFLVTLYLDFLSINLNLQVKASLPSAASLFNLTQRTMSYDCLIIPNLHDCLQNCFS